MKDIEYLRLLSEQYPNIDAVSSEIINLQAVLNLPKETEHFLADLHGEYEAFQHMLRTASGVLKFKIDDIFGDKLGEEEKKELITLISYPEQKLKLLNSDNLISAQWYRKTLLRIIKIAKVVSSKYSRSKVRKNLPEDFAYILDELLYLKNTEFNKEEYYNQIIQTIIEIGQGEKFIISLAYLIQSFAVNRLHIIGDIFDRGPKPDRIISKLMEHYNCEVDCANYDNFDIQWGNHDILWMGAALGQRSLLATTIRNTLRYGNLKLLEESYGINMRPLARFAMEFYEDVNCKLFAPRVEEGALSNKDKNIIAQMHKAITIIQFKLEGELRRRRPEFAMEEEIYLDKIDYRKGTIKWEGEEYSLIDTNFPTIDPENPHKLTDEEEELINQLSNSFKNSYKLQEHIRFLFNKGSIYLKYNDNLLFHGSVPITQSGELLSLKIEGKEYKGKDLFDFFAEVIQKSYSYKFEEEDYRDWLWYLWRGKSSPLFGKEKMTTFFRYFTKEKSLHKEKKNPYYKLREDEEICNMILTEFGLDPQKSHIINGHTPVEEKSGECPIKGAGKMIVIDGGMSSHYRAKTGIAGYTLIYNSYGLRLVSHKPFISCENAIKEGDDIISSIRVVEKIERKKISDTDKGKKIKEKIDDLMRLLDLYKKSIIKER